MQPARSHGWISLALGSLLAFFPVPGGSEEVAEIPGEPRAAAQSVAPRDPRSASPETILRRAFDNQYEVDTTSKIELVMHNRGGQERTRRFEAAQKIIDDRVHSIGRLVYPEYLRDMAILQIEGSDRSHDAFVYLPSLGKSRRVSTHQRGDALFGTDVTYEDLERRYLEDYRIIAFGTGEWLGEAIYRIAAHPLHATSYAEVVFFIAQSDASILRADYYKRQAETPYRTLRAERSSMVTLDGHTLATRLTIENRTRGTRTEVTFGDLRVNPEIDDRLFSVRTLEQRRDFEKAF